MMVTEPTPEFHTCGGCGRLFMSLAPPRTFIEDPLCTDCAQELDETLADLSARGVSIQIGGTDEEALASEPVTDPGEIRRYYRATIGGRWVAGANYDDVAALVHTALDQHPDWQATIDTVEMGEQAYQALLAFEGWS